MKSNNPYAQHLLCASGLFGLCMAASVLAVNRFEPIRGAWPEEYGGFVLVVGFAVLMVHRGFLLTAENQRLNLHLQDEVERETRALETLLAERRELLANLIHDVKNPLTAVRSYTDLVRSGGTALDDETFQYLDALAERVDAVEDRFNSLQGFSREERLHLTAGSLCLNDFMQRFYQANRPDIELSGHTFHLELPDAPLFSHRQPRPAAGSLRKPMLQRPVFYATGRLLSSRSCSPSRREEDWALISVADTGVGIRPEDLPHVFKRGFTRRADHSGDGLGLFIVHTVALEHGGMAKVDSRPNEGAVFSLSTFPLSPLPLEPLVRRPLPSPKGSKAPPTAKAAGGAPLHVLLISGAGEWGSPWGSGIYKYPLHIRLEFLLRLFHQFRIFCQFDSRGRQHFSAIEHSLFTDAHTGAGGVT